MTIMLMQMIMVVTDYMTYALGNNVKAMDDGQGWAHDDKNGNVEELSSYAQLVSLNRSSV